MGLLDDAIREHLDLKRRRGADPEEIERAEREALGPVRRGPEEAGEVEAGFEELEEYEEPAAYDHEEDLGWEDEHPVAGEVEDAVEPPSFMRSAEAEPEALDREILEEPPAPASRRPSEEVRREPPDDQEPIGRHEPRNRDLTWTVDPGGAPIPSAPEPEPPAPTPAAAPPARDPEPSGREPETPSSSDRPEGHTSDETAEYDVEQELERGDDDVLEETPEFLQDTPDHDRLWFEQRPPRDFDFDG